MTNTYQYSHWLLPLLVSVVIQFRLGFYAYRKREEIQARTFVWLMASLLVWTICYTLELSSAELAGKIIWLRFKYIGSASAPIIWLIFSLQFTQNEKFITRRTQAFLWGYYIITLAVVFTSDWHHWMWGSVWIEPGLLEDQVTHGWYFWFYVVSVYLIILVSSWLYIRFLWVVPAAHQKQALLMAVGGLIPLLGRITLDIFGLDLVPQLDEVVFLFLASTLIFSAALFRYNVLSIMPIAYHQVFRSMQIGTIVLDPQSRVIELNPAATRMIGMESSNVQGQPLQKLWPHFAEIQLASELATELTVRTNHNEHHYHCQVSIIHDRLNRISGYLVMLTDITQQKKNALALETLASQDGLTGLLNRRTFMDLAKVEHQRSKRYEHSYAIILLDLDHFKRVNDTYGHQCGDHALQEVAYRIKKNLRGTDFVGRYGGEEFIVLLPETKQHVAALTAEKIRSVVSNMAIQSSQAEASFCVTLSAGVALFTSEGEEEQITLETVLSRADKMLYVSKKDGRNRVSVWPNKKSHSSDSIRSG